MDEHGPKPITIQRKYGYSASDTEPVDVYPVPGTDGVWAVYPNIEDPKRWVGVHVPTGLAAYNNFASREEAEDVLCWIWCNAIDQKGLQSTDGKEVTHAMGPRVLSRFKRGGPLKQPRRKRTQHIGQTEVDVSDEAAYYAKRLGELGAEREKWLKQMRSERELLAEQDRLATLRERTVAKLEKEANAEALRLREGAIKFSDEQHALLTKAKTQIEERQNQLETDRLELTNQGIELNKLRTAMFHALQAVDVGAVLADGEPSIGRHLRKVRIKGVFNPELDPSEPAESS